jgi:hypothetical protein
VAAGSISGLAVFGVAKALLLEKKPNEGLILTAIISSSLVWKFFDLLGTDARFQKVETSKSIEHE